MPMTWTCSNCQEINDIGEDYCLYCEAPANEEDDEEEFFYLDGEKVIITAGPADDE